jgi:hypothetical protein
MSEWQVHGKCIQLSDNDNVCVADNLTDSAQIKEVAAWPKVPRKRDAFQRHMDGLFSPTGWLTVHQPTVYVYCVFVSDTARDWCHTPNQSYRWMGHGRDDGEEVLAIVLWGS